MMQLRILFLARSTHTDPLLVLDQQQVRAEEWSGLHQALDP